MKKSQIFLYLCLLIILGVAVFDFFIDKIPENEDIGEVEFVGVVRDVDERVDNQKLICQLADKNQKLKINVLITTDLYPEYKYGDELKIFCDLQRPKEFEGFDYPRYLAMKGIYYVCYYPQVTLISRDNGNWVYARILRLKGRLRQVIERGLPEPQSAIFAAMFLGVRRGISEELSDKLSRVGASHVIAISGLHITIISGILMSVLIGLGMWRKQAFWVAAIFLTLYIIMIGAPASAVRAGIMGFLVLLAMNLGRLNRSINALLLVACIMLITNPRILRSDVGFQLSFLAVIGIIYFSPWFEKLFRRVPEKFGLRQSLVMTMSAQVMTLPLIAYQFNRVSIVAPVVNILILPILPFVLMLGAVATIGGLIAQSFDWTLGLVQVLFLPTWLLLMYLVKVVEVFSSLNFAGVEVESVPFVAVVGLYIIIAIGIRLLQRER